MDVVVKGAVLLSHLLWLNSRTSQFLRRRGFMADQPEWVPRYSGPNRSGICVCGHSYEDHHLSLVMNPTYIAATHEGYIPDECLYYGCNEDGGLDEEGNPHCFRYVDSMEEIKS